MLQIKGEKIDLDNRIRLLDSLKNPTLSDEEYLKLVSACYFYEKDNESYLRDIAKVLGVPSKNVIEVTLHTNLVTASGQQVVFNAYATEEFFTLYDTDYNYSASEITNLIKSKSIFISYASLWTTKKLPNCKLCDMDTIEEFIATKRTLTNLGLYQDWFLSFIKKALSKQRITKDILEIIALLKIDLNMRKMEIEQSMSDLDKELTLTRELSKKLDGYLESCMEALTSGRN